MTHFKFRLKKSVVAVGDIKPYEKQTTRTTDQGGSSLDWLALPVSGGKMLMPAEYSRIFSNFVKGIYVYLPPKDPKAVEKKDKQTVRGLRVLLEVPFLHPDQASIDQLISELDEMIKTLDGGGKLSNDAMEQIDKLIANAQFGGARNRFVSLDPNSPEYEIERRVKIVNEKLGLKNGTHPHIPEFISYFDIANRKGKDSCGMGSKGFLMKQDDFFGQFTDNKKIYHGTSFDSILAIIRNGLYVSDDKQGKAYFGRGAYASPKREVALGYGTPIELPVRTDAPIRVLNWDVLSLGAIGEAFGVHLESLGLSAKDPNIFEKLASICDVDFIIHGHVLIQNSGAIILPSSVSDFIRLYADRLKGLIASYLVNSSPPEAQVTKLMNELPRAIEEYRSFYTLGEYLGLKDVDLPDAVVNILIQGLTHHAGENAQLRFARILADMQMNDPKLRAFYEEQYERNPSEFYKAEMARALLSTFSTEESVQNRMAKDLRGHPSVPVRLALAETLGTLRHASPELEQGLVQAVFEDSNPVVSTTAALAIADGFELSDETVLEPIFNQALNYTRAVEDLARIRAFKALVSVRFKKFRNRNMYEISSDALQKEPNEEVRAAAVEALVSSIEFSLDRAGTLKVLRDVFRKDDSFAVRSAIATSIAKENLINKSLLKSLIQFSQKLSKHESLPESFSKTCADSLSKFMASSTDMSPFLRGWVVSPKQEDSIRIFSAEALNRFMRTDSLSDEEKDENRLALLDGLATSGGDVQAACKAGLRGVRIHGRSLSRFSHRIEELFNRNDSRLNVELAWLVRSSKISDLKLHAYLLKMLESEDEVLRAAAVEPLKYVQPMAFETKSYLVHLLTHAKVFDTRKKASEILASFVEEGRPQVRLGILGFFMTSVNEIVEEANSNLWGEADLTTFAELFLRIMSFDEVFEELVRVLKSNDRILANAKKLTQVFDPKWDECATASNVALKPRWREWVNGQGNLVDAFSKEELDLMIPAIRQFLKASWEAQLDPEY